MSYIDGFVIAVPTANKQKFIEHARQFAPIFIELGAIRVIEGWGDDVPDGKLTSFPLAVQRKPDETVIFSWITWPSRQMRDEGMKKFMADPRVAGMTMPFDGQRMIYGGFTPLIDERNGSKTGYVDGCLVPVPSGNKDAYREMATKTAALFKEYGATRVVEAWGDDVPDGKVTDYKGAVKATGDEKVVYSWIEWPSKEVRDEGWKKIMADSRMHAGTMPFDGKRMIYGGFAPMLDV